MNSFRSEVFNLCKVLSAMEQFEDLRKTMNNLRFSTSDAAINPRADVCANGIRLQAEFFGLLLAFQNKLSSFPNIETDNIALSDEEYQSIEKGHNYILRFIELCLEDIKCQNSALGRILSPYSFFKPVDDISSLNIDSSIFSHAVNAFKNSSVYRSLMVSNALMAFNKIPEDTIRNLFGVLYRDIVHGPMDAVPSEILALKLREQGFKPNQQINPVDALQLISFKLLALREMMSTAASLIYDAILGSDLVVIDENSLITIEKSSSNAIRSYKTILIQGGLLCPYNDILNTVFLLDIDNDKVKIHDFGRANSSTFSFANGNGETTKLSYCVLDEELNPIFNLTK